MKQNQSINHVNIDDDNYIKIWYAKNEKMMNTIEMGKD